MLANLDARGGRGGRSELAADIVRGVGLHVKAVVLRQAAGEEDVDARLGFAAGTRSVGRGAGLTEAGQMVHSQPDQADRAGLEHRPAAKGRAREGVSRWHAALVLIVPGPNSKLQSRANAERGIRAVSARRKRVWY